MTKTFENAKAIGYADLLEKIKAANLTEYGLCPATMRMWTEHCLVS